MSENNNLCEICGTEPVFSDTKRCRWEECENAPEVVEVYQDGAEFYRADSGNLVFTASRPVGDFDLHTAQLAREEYEAWALAGGGPVPQRLVS